MKKQILLLLLSSMFLHFNTDSENQKGKRFKNTIHETIWSVYSQKKDPKKSFSTLLKLAKKNKYAYKWLISLLHKTGNFGKISQMIPLIKATFPDILQNDPDTGFMLAHALMRCKGTFQSSLFACKQKQPLQLAYDQGAMDIIQPLNKKFPTHQQVAALTAALYDLSNDPLNALVIAEKYLNSSATKPTDFIIYFKNTARYIKLGKKNKALASIKKCIELQPGFVPALILSANLNNEMNKIEEAISNCKAALETAGPNKMIIFMLIKLFFKLKKAQHKLSEFVLNKECMEKAMKLLEEKKYDKALNFIDTCLAKKTKPDEKTKKEQLKIKVIS